MNSTGIQVVYSIQAQPSLMASGVVTGTRGERPVSLRLVYFGICVRFTAA